MYDLIIHNARIYPMAGDAGCAAYTSLAVKEGLIAAFDVATDTPANKKVDAGGALLLPGFIDCHTHALYAGDRMAEHSMKLNGASYADIARQGGGILSTVAAVRAATEQQLVEQTLPRLAALRAEGVTTVEIKSGYGLRLEDELKMLRAIGELRESAGMNVAATFLGPHSVPSGSDKAAYLDEVIQHMLPAVADQGLADCVDIFVESIAFDTDDLQRYFDAADKLGFRLRAHTDQLTNIGATRSACAYPVLSCDHLEYANGEDIRAMAGAEATAVLLPGAFYFLRETRKPPIELLRAQQVPIAIATDLNPGSSPVASLHTVMHMGCIMFGLTPAEALLGVTCNAARAMGMDRRVGSLTQGMQADFCLWDLPSPEFLLYQLGGLRPKAIFHKGKLS